MKNAGPNSLIKLVLHSIRMHLVQSISVALSVAFATAAIAAFAYLYLGAEQGRAQASERGGAQYVVIPSDSHTLISDEDLLFTGAPATMYMPMSDFERVLSFTGVTRASYQFYCQTLDSSCCSSSHPTRLIGIDPATDFVVSPLLLESGNLDEMLAEGNIIIGSQVDGYESGYGEVLGLPQTVSGVLAPTGTDLDHSIIVSVTVARALSASQAGYEHFWEKYGEPETLLSTILVDFDDESLATATNKLESIGGVKVIERSVIVEQSARQLSGLLAILAGAGLVLAVASLLQLLARFYTMVWDRRAEFALYEAIGASRSTLLRMVSLEAGLLVGTGLLVGAALSAVFSALLLAHASRDGSSFAFITPGIGEVFLIDCVVIIAFVLIALLSVGVSLSRIVKIDPSLAMRQVDIG